MELAVKIRELSCNDLVKALERNVAILKTENHYNLKIGYELENKLTWYNNVSRALADKLDSLWKLSEAQHSPENEIKQFADKISRLWISMNRQICEKYTKIRMASRTSHGVPLSLILDKVKKEIILLKKSLKLNQSIYNKDYILKGYQLITESEEHISSLEKCDSKLQQYLSLTNITPYLIKLETAIDKYVTTVELLPIKKSFSSDLSIFSLVTKLLTGELLDHEYIDPNYILMENIPKKPVFIIKNIKRKTTCPHYPT